MSEQRVFKEAVNGYGFEEIKQTAEGVFCQGCLTTHKRPTKMYASSFVTITPVCRFAITRFYNVELDYDEDSAKS